MLSQSIVLSSLRRRKVGQFKAQPGGEIVDRDNTPCRSDSRVMLEGRGADENIPLALQVTPDDPVIRSISTDLNDTPPPASLTAGEWETGSGSRLNADAAEASPIHEQEDSHANEEVVDESEPEPRGEESGDEEQWNHEKNNDDNEAEIDAEPGVRMTMMTMTATIVPMRGITQVTLTPLALTRKSDHILRNGRGGMKTRTMRQVRDTQPLAKHSPLSKLSVSEIWRWS
jgi:hypothetical protein